MMAQEDEPILLRGKTGAPGVNVRKVLMIMPHSETAGTRGLEGLVSA